MKSKQKAKQNHTQQVSRVSAVNLRKDTTRLDFKNPK